MPHPAPRVQAQEAPARDANPHLSSPHSSGNRKTLQPCIHCPGQWEALEIKLGTLSTAPGEHSNCKGAQGPSELSPRHGLPLHPRAPAFWPLHGEYYGALNTATKAIAGKGYGKRVSLGKTEVLIMAREQPGHKPHPQEPQSKSRMGMGRRYRVKVALISPAASATSTCLARELGARGLGIIAEAWAPRWWQMPTQWPWHTL